MTQKRLCAALPNETWNFLKARGINLIGLEQAHTRDIKDVLDAETRSNEESFQEWGRLINMIGLRSDR